MTAGTRTTNYTYDLAGNLTQVTQPDGTTTLTTGYDTAHRPVSLTNTDSESITYTLDALGDITQAVTKDSTSAVKRQHGASFDALGRMLTDEAYKTTTTKKITTLAYDDNGNLTTSADPLSHATMTGYDGLNRVVSVQNAASGTTTTAYDAHDRPLTVTTPNGAVTHYTYNGFGDLTQEVSPDRGTTTYSYDANGNLTKRVDARGASAGGEMDQTFDVLDRVLTRTYPTHSANNVTFTYDQSGHGDGLGRLTSVIDPSGTLSRSYDERGSLTSEARTQGTHTLTTSFAYNANNDLVTLTYPSGTVVTYTRDGEQNISKVQIKPYGSSTTTLAHSGVKHFPFGPLKNFTSGDGLFRGYTRDLDYRTTILSDGTGGSFLKFTYAYDDADNVTSITNANDATRTQTFGYDTLNRLTSASSTGYGSLAWGYDANGNRNSYTKGSTSITYAVTANSNRIASATIAGTTQNVIYDAAGNVKQLPTNITGGASPGDNAFYNDAGQLYVLALPALTTNYHFNAFGQRTMQNAGSDPTNYYIYGRGGELLEENNFTAQPFDYVYIDSIPVAEVQAGTIYYQHSDNLGSAYQVTNSSAAAVWDIGPVKPFGDDTFVTTAGGFTTNNLRFPGQVFDGGYNNNGVRDYIPTLGRYFESDPVGLAGGTNTYAYAASNPVRFTDPSGRWIAGAIVGGISGAIAGYLSDPEHPAIGAGAGFAVGFVAGGILPDFVAAPIAARIAAAGVPRVLARFGAYAAANGAVAASGTAVSNYLEGKSPGRGVGYSFAIGASLPLFSDGPAFAYGVESKGIENWIMQGITGAEGAGSAYLGQCLQNPGPKVIYDNSPAIPAGNVIVGEAIPVPLSNMAGGKTP